MAEGLAEGGWLPYWTLRKGIRYRCGQVLAEMRKGDVVLEQKDKMDFIQKVKQQPIAINTQDANEQHYEVPTEFFSNDNGKTYEIFKLLLHREN